MKNITRAAVLLLWTVGSATAQGVQANVPLAVIGVSYVPAQETVEFTLLNESHQTVTAWEVSIKAVGPTGFVLKSQGFGTDSYLSAAGIVPGGLHINPGDTITTKRSIPAIRDATVSVEARTAILADGTAFGDAGDIEYFFGLRDRDYVTWSEVLGVLRDVSRGETGTAALRAAVERLRSPVNGGGGNPIRENAIGNIQIAVSDADQGRANPISRMQDLIDDAQRRLSAAAASRRPSAAR